MAFQKSSHTFTKIHLKALRTNQFKILFALSFTVFINTFSFAQDIPKKGEPIEPKPEKTLDTVTKSLDSLVKIVIPETPKDTTVVDSITPKKKEFLENIVIYKATDYTSLNQRKQKLYLFNEAEITYGDLNIKAGDITIDYQKTRFTLEE
ncbi:hypothetical protein JCM19302_2408 [Jejuia pallidilutea]|uniref:Uncharacterized protein n=1 Tax=Jejuia pallidilutea TaxID=504487 RepID=A0A090W183_9FLAO|nr:hypothetical protein JCM19302_2408 [Jejuia pallidilutea]